MNLARVTIWVVGILVVGGCSSVSDEVGSSVGIETAVTTQPTTISTTARTADAAPLETDLVSTVPATVQQATTQPPSVTTSLTKSETQLAEWGYTEKLGDTDWCPDAASFVAAQVVRAEDFLNVRSGPGGEHDIVQQLAPGFSPVTMYFQLRETSSTGSEWVKIYMPSPPGWDDEFDPDNGPYEYGCGWVHTSYVQEIGERVGG